MEGGGGDGGCQTPAVVIPIEDDWMESEVIMGFRVWQLMFLALAGLITVVVLLCCFMKCRVPRTKQEIEADSRRREITRRFRFLLDRVPVEDTSLRTAIEKVSELYTNREKMKKRKKKIKPDEEEEIISIDSSYLFEDEKLTIIERVKKLVGLLREDEEQRSDSDEDRSEMTKRGSEEEDLSSPHKEEAKPSSEESEDTPKLADSRVSKLSLFHDSPPKTHDTLSKLSLLQDSPLNNGLSLLQDTPPHKRKLSKEETHSTIDSQDSNKANKTESQDSETSTAKKQDSQDSDKSPKPRLSFAESTQGRFRASDSQDSEDSQQTTPRQKSDSQDSNESDKSKSRPTLEPSSRDSRLTRRESIGGLHSQDVRRKIWGQQKLSPGGEAKTSRKGSKSLDVVSAEPD